MNQPPRNAGKLLQSFLKDDLLEEVQGDLEEKYLKYLKIKSKRKADWNYWFQVVNYLRPFALRSISPKFSNRTIMIKNHFFVAFRNLRKNKFYASINIMSLTLGIAACLIIYLFINEERSFDGQHSQSQDLFRLCEVQSFPGTNTQNVALTMGGMGPAMVRDYPEVEKFSRYWGMGKRIWRKGEERLIVEKGVRVDSAFLEMFDFKWVDGDRTTALYEPRSIVVTKETAFKFFDNLDVIGETLELGDNTYKITGIIENVPEQSHMQFDLLMSMATIYQERPDFDDSWGGNFLVTYLQLTPGADLEKLAGNFPQFLIDNTGNEEIGEYYKLFLQPFEMVHLGSMDIEHDYHNHRKFNGEYLGIFTMVGIFILIIAGVNFMNLTTARSSNRAKEVGVRKAVGAKKSNLFWQFIVESILMSLIALALGIILDFIFLPFLNDLIDRELSLLSLLKDPFLMGLVTLIAIVLGLLAGLYPSLYLSSFQVVKVLKGLEKTEKKSFFRSSLIITQFSLAMAMLVATVVVLQQLNFMRTTDIGFDKSHMLLIDLNRTANDKFDVLKERLLKSSHVQGVTASGQRLGENFHQWGFQAEVDTGMLNITPSNVNVEYDYLKVYDIELVAGRGFSKEFSLDEGRGFVINESFAKELGYEEPVGKRVGHSWYHRDSLGTIIGVTKDFNFNSLHYEVNTLSMVVHSDWGYDELSVKLNGENLQAGIKDVEDVWRDLVPDYPFQYSFLDEHFEELYRSDQQMSSVISIIAILSVLIGAMGLFGLSSISIERRIKEIGIRKVMGAGKIQLLLILSNHFAKLIAFSFMIAAPTTWYFLGQWLDDFAYRVDLQIDIFFLAGLVTFAIAMLTISYHTLKAAASNPVRALRYE